MRVLWFSLALLAVDQVSKTLVHLYMVQGQSISIIGDLLKFTYTTNPGMAFGLEIGSKLFLSLFSMWFLSAHRPRGLPEGRSKGCRDDVRHRCAWTSL
jgi:lipoprotein signal peptidase